MRVFSAAGNLKYQHGCDHLIAILPPTLFDDLLWNHHPVDHTIARKLSRYTGMDAGYRINMQTAYQRAKDRRVTAQPSAQAG